MSWNYYCFYPAAMLPTTTSFTRTVQVPTTEKATISPQEFQTQTASTIEPLTASPSTAKDSNSCLDYRELADCDLIASVGMCSHQPYSTIYCCKTCRNLALTKSKGQSWNGQRLKKVAPSRSMVWLHCSCYSQSISRCLELDVQARACLTRKVAWLIWKSQWWLFTNQSMHTGHGWSWRSRQQDCILGTNEPMLWAL